MIDEIREQLNSKLASCSEQEFFIKYIKLDPNFLDNSKNDLYPQNIDDVYKERREISEEAKDDGTLPGSVDCGEASVREDFSNYAELSERISFEDMFPLEKYYERLN